MRGAPTSRRRAAVVLAAVLLSAPAILGQAVKIYWTNGDPGQIKRANPDGTMVEDFIASGLPGSGQVPDVAVSGDVFLDDVTLGAVAQAAKAPIVVTEATAHGLLAAVA